MALTAACLVQGCAQPQVTATGTRLYASDLAGGAKSCTVPTISAVAGKETPVTMKLGNDGGWCGINIAQGGHPYAAGLLVKRPAHGKIYIHSVGDQTRVDFTPDAGFTGSDSFDVKLVPDDATLRVAVTVTPNA